MKSSILLPLIVATVVGAATDTAAFRPTGKTNTVQQQHLQDILHQHGRRSTSGTGQVRDILHHQQQHDGEQRSNSREHGRHHRGRGKQRKKRHKKPSKKRKRKKRNDKAAAEPQWFSVAVAAITEEGASSALTQPGNGLWEAIWKYDNYNPDSPFFSDSARVLLEPSLDDKYQLAAFLGVSLSGGYMIYSHLIPLL